MENRFIWSQEGNKIIVSAPEGEIYWIMPDDLELSKIHIDLLKLVECLLFSPWHPELLKDWYDWSRRPGKNIVLSFSTGIDSTAAMHILPEDTYLLFHQRDGFTCGQLNLENPLRMIKEMNNEKDRKNKVMIIKSNHESVMLYHVKDKAGFSTEWCCALHAILLADYLDLKYICFGGILDEFYLRCGREFRDFSQTDYWKKWSSLFEKAGLKIILPTVGCSEVITTKIVRSNKYKDKSLYCLRGTNGQPCGKCYKCFRKGMLAGIKYKKTPGIIELLKKRHLNVGSSMIYGMQKNKLDLPELVEYKDLDMGWLEKYYPPYLDLIPKDLREVIRKNIEKYAKPMNDSDIKKFKEFKTLK